MKQMKEGVNEIKWSTLPCEWKMNHIDDENKKKRKTGMHLWIMKAEWAMMKDEWQMMKDEWQMMNDERQMMSDSIALTLSFTH